MKILLDTHSLIWFLSSSDRLSDNAREIIFSADVIFLPTVVLLEAFHVSKKLNFEKEFRKFLSYLPSPKFQTLPLDINIVNTYINFEDNLEIHDRVIVSSASSLDLPIVTKDENISEIYPNVIW